MLGRRASSGRTGQPGLAMSLVRSASSSTTLDLIDVMVNGLGQRDYPAMVEHARKNKVLLQLLRMANENGPLRVREEESYRETVAALGEVSKRLTGLRYSLMKFNKPVSYSPADIDLLMSINDLPTALHRLSELGYEQIVCEPYCVTLRKKVVLDLYTHPCVANLPYVDGRILLEHAREMEVAGLTVTSLDREAEAMLAASHAVYKEQLFTLNDYLTFNGWSGRLTEGLSREARVEPAVRMSTVLSQQVRLGNLELPYRLGLAEFLEVFSAKLARDSQTRSSVAPAIASWHGREFFSRLLASRTRSTY